MIGLIAGFAFCLGVMILARESDFGIPSSDPLTATLGLGFLLLASYVSGRTAKSARLPRITGYLAIGIAVGPFGYNLLPAEMLAHLKGIDGVAVALIALTAGGEMRTDYLRERGRQILITGFSYIVLALALAVGVQLVLSDLFVYMPSGDPFGAVLVALAIGGVVISLSPMVSIAVINETGARGPLASMILGTVILLDLLVILIMAIVITAASSHFDASSEQVNVALQLARELGGSIVVGLGFGLLIRLYLTHIKRQIVLFVLALAFVMSFAAGAWHLELLLVALAAGFYIENFVPQLGHSMVQGIERVSLPVYALFFAMAGAKVDLGVIASHGYLALILAGMRLLGNVVGTRLGAKFAGTEPVVQRNIWMGMVSQAGISLALVALLRDRFDWGAEAATLLIAMIAMHEIVGPILTTRALRKAGETAA